MEKCFWDTCPWGTVLIWGASGLQQPPPGLRWLCHHPTDTSSDPHCLDWAGQGPLLRASLFPLLVVLYSWSLRVVQASLARPLCRGQSWKMRAGVGPRSRRDRGQMESPPAWPEYVEAEFMFYSAVKMHTRLYMHI